MKKVSTLLAVLMLSAGIASVAQADAFTDQVVTDLQSKGYTHIEIKVGATTVKVEANNGTNRVEVTYNKATGEIIKSETGRVEPGEDTTPGVEVETGDDHGGHGDDDGEDGEDDHGGSNSGSGHDSEEDQHEGEHENEHEHENENESENEGEGGHGGSGHG